MIQKIDALIQKHDKEQASDEHILAAPSDALPQELVEHRPQLERRPGHVELDFPHGPALSIPKTHLLPDEFTADLPVGREPEFRFITSFDPNDTMLYFSAHHQDRVEIIDLSEFATDDVSSHLTQPITIVDRHAGRQLHRTQTKNHEQPFVILDAKALNQKEYQGVFFTAAKQNEAIEKKSQVFFLKDSKKKDDFKQSYVPDDFEERAQILREKLHQLEEQEDKVEEAQKKLEKEQQQKYELKEKERKRQDKEGQQKQELNEKEKKRLEKEQQQKHELDAKERKRLEKEEQQKRELEEKEKKRQERLEKRRRELEEKEKIQLEKAEQKKREHEGKVQKQIEKEREKLLKYKMKVAKTQEKKEQKNEEVQPSESLMKHQLKEQQRLGRINARRAIYEERLKLKREKQMLKEQVKHRELIKADDIGKYNPEPAEIDSDIKKILQITDELLGELPEEVINRFMRSDEYDLYERILNKYKIR
ncbi:MAG TPA: hypothetical protein VMT57_08160 [Candidatus Thermoplasmatota archaeon]|nr:hypothetical protein [Candidatus Thermoplasmatota archaeon]